MKNGENSRGFPGLWWFRRLSVYLQCRRPGFDPWVGKIPWRKKWQSTPVLLPGKSHGQRSLVGYSPWRCKELDTTERLHFHLNFYTKTTYVFCRKREWLSCVWLFVTPWIHSPWNFPGQTTGVGSLSLGEGNGTPLQYCCLENPMDGGAWKAAVHGVAQSQTRLKWLSRSSSSLSLLQGIFPTQWSNLGLPHYRWILYQLSHQGSPRILEWVAYPFSSRSSDPGIEPGSPALQADSLATELSEKPFCRKVAINNFLKCQWVW